MGNSTTDYLKPITRISPYLQEDWVFLVLIGILAALAFMRYSYPRMLHRRAEAVVRSRMLLQLMREDMVLSHRVAITLFVVFCLSSGLLIFLTAKNYHWPMGGLSGFNFFLISSGVVMLVYIWKLLSIRIVQLLFGGNGGLSEYLNYTFVVNSFLGLLWLPVVLIASVVLKESAGVVLVVAFACFALAWLVRIIQGVVFALNQGVLLVYIILYLCTLEILPLAVLAKGIAGVKF